MQQKSPNELLSDLLLDRYNDLVKEVECLAEEFHKEVLRRLKRDGHTHVPIVLRVQKKPGTNSVSFDWYRHSFGGSSNATSRKPVREYLPKGIGPRYHYQMLKCVGRKWFDLVWETEKSVSQYRLACSEILKARQVALSALDRSQRVLNGNDLIKDKAQPQKNGGDDLNVSSG